MPDPAPPPDEDIVDRLLRREAEGLACLSEVLARREIERLRALIAAAPDLAKALADLVETFRARTDLWRLCGPHEERQVYAACRALANARWRAANA